MAYLTQLDVQLLLFIHDALRHEPLHNFWAGISFLDRCTTFGRA